MSASSLRAGTMMETRGRPRGPEGKRSHSGFVISTILRMPRAASTMRENHAKASTIPEIQWKVLQVIPRIRTLMSILEVWFSWVSSGSLILPLGGRPSGKRWGEFHSVKEYRRRKCDGDGSRDQHRVGE